MTVWSIAQGGNGMRAVADRRYFLLLMGGLIVLAWLTLWLWGQSPYGRLLNHDKLNSVDLSGADDSARLLA